MFNLGNSDKNVLALQFGENKYYDENITIDINDKNNTHSIIASKIKKGSVVLDVGCGAGYIGKLLLNSNCELYGIDYDQEALNVSKKIGCYTGLYKLSITDENTNEYIEFMNNKNKFDYILFADVLEHVVDPGGVLFNFSKLLKQNGKFLISVPNIAHLDILKELTNRTFNYNQIGILDNTHLRFFTKESFIEFIKNINETYNLKFGAKLIGKTISEPWYVNNYPELFKIINYDNELCVLQYVFEVSNNISNFDLVKYEDNFSKIEIELQKKKELDISVENQNKTIVLQDKEINKLNNEKNRVEQEWKKLDDKKKELENIINNFKNDYTQLENNYSDLQNEYNDICVVLESYKNEVNKILSSRSWKVTKPLRNVSKIINHK